MHGHGGVIVRGVGKPEFTGKFRRLRLQPGGIRLDARGVDDEEINAGGKLVGIQIVNDAAAFVAHQGVLALAGRELADVVGENRIQKCRRARTADGDFAHVGDVENAGGVADGKVLVGDAGVLHRHFPTAEFDKFAAEFLVGGKKWCAFEHIKFPAVS